MGVWEQALKKGLGQREENPEHDSNKQKYMALISFLVFSLSIFKPIKKDTILLYSLLQTVPYPRQANEDGLQNWIKIKPNWNWHLLATQV